MREEWEIRELKEVCTIRPPKREARSLLAETDFVSFVPMADLGINKKYLIPSEYKTLSEVYSGYTYFMEGDVLLAKITPCFENGKLGIAKDLKNGVGFGSSEYVVYRVSEKLNNEFLYYFLNQESFRKTGSSQMAGAVGHKRITKAFYEDSILPIPPLQEQQQIVAILDEAFEAIDQAIANIEINIANAQELFQSKLNEIFSQRGEGWEEKKLGEVCLNLDSKRVPITKSKRTPGDIPYYGASGIVDYVADYLFDEDLLLVSEDGANLLARTYPIAFSISGKTWVNNHAHVLKFNEMTSQKFIEYYLNSIKLDDYISGMAQPKLNQRMLNSIPIPFPSLPVQERVLEIISTLDNEIEDLNKLYSTKLEGLKELKKSILQKAFAGELTNKVVESLQLAAEPGEHY